MTPIHPIKQAIYASNTLATARDLAPLIQYLQSGDTLGALRYAQGLIEAHDSLVNAINEGKIESPIQGHAATFAQKFGVKIDADAINHPLFRKAV